MAAFDNSETRRPAPVARIMHTFGQQKHEIEHKRMWAQDFYASATAMRAERTAPQRTAAGTDAAT
jgi:hypothetical protein